MVIQQQSKKFKQCTIKLYGSTSETVHFILHSIKHKQICQNLLSLHGMKKAHLNELSHRERNLLIIQNSVKWEGKWICKAESIVLAISSRSPREYEDR
jgi:hypothetical protein